MNLFSWVVVVLATFAVIAPAATSTHSAKRGPNESFESALKRYEKRLEEMEHPVYAGGTAYNEAVPMAQLDISRLPQWRDYSEVRQGFETMRNARFLYTTAMPNFPRRSSWLYPDDGCFARAALGGQNLERWGYLRPYKVFIFGNLSVRTTNSPSGYVSWWYHVVPAVRLGSDVYILDPAIESKKPLKLADWVATMTSNSTSVKLSICNPYSYTPSSRCEEVPSGDGQARHDQMTYLDYEWNRLVSMGRDPKKELGDLPPWLNSPVPSIPSARSFRPSSLP